MRPPGLSNLLGAYKAMTMHGAVLARSTSHQLDADGATRHTSDERARGRITGIAEHSVYNRAPAAERQALKYWVRDQGTYTTEQQRRRRGRAAASWIMHMHHVPSSCRSSEAG